VAAPSHWRRSRDHAAGTSRHGGGSRSALAAIALHVQHRSIELAGRQEAATPPRRREITGTVRNHTHSLNDPLGTTHHDTNGSRLWKPGFHVSKGTGRRQSGDLRRLRSICLNLRRTEMVLGRGLRLSTRWFEFRNAFPAEQLAVGTVYGLRETHRNRRIQRNPLDHQDKRRTESRSEDMRIPNPFEFSRRPPMCCTAERQSA
jgi:hypothetical protein